MAWVDTLRLSRMCAWLWKRHPACWLECLGPSKMLVPNYAAAADMMSAGLEPTAMNTASRTGLSMKAVVDTEAYVARRGYDVSDSVQSPKRRTLKRMVK